MQKALADTPKIEAPIVEIPTLVDTSTSSIKSFIAQNLKLQGLPDSYLSIPNCESGFNPLAVGDHGTSYGLWQIHLPAHLDVTKEQALDPVWSTRWAMAQLKLGKAKIWSCFKG